MFRKADKGYHLQKYTIMYIIVIDEICAIIGEAWRPADVRCW